MKKTESGIHSTKAFHLNMNQYCPIKLFNRKENDSCNFILKLQIIHVAKKFVTYLNFFTYHISFLFDMKSLLCRDWIQKNILGL